MIKKILLSLLILIAATTAVEAAEEEQKAEPTFKERSANLAEIKAIRVGYGSGTIRIVTDITKKVDFTESYAENPSRIIVDLKNAWLNPKVQREFELKSLAAKKLRVAQFDSTTVRIVIETMADTRPFFLSGGAAGYRFVIDVGNAEFKENPELNKPNTSNTEPPKNETPPTPSTPEQPKPTTPTPPTPTDPAVKEIPKDIEIIDPEDVELEKKRAQELKEKQERELKEKQERELKEKQERELKEKQERELKEKQERELKEKQERELKEKQERELKEKQERELKEKQERELKEKREKELKEKREREIKEQREREKELKEKEKREKKEREKKDKDKKSKDKDKNKDEEKTVDTPFKDLEDDLNKLTNLKGKLIVIDPGHGGNDAGAIGPTGVMEKNVTLKVSLELKRLLEAEGAEVVMTRETDSTVSSKGAKASDIEELGARCEVANRIGAEIFISIHADSFTRPEARGTTGYYYSKSTTGKGQKLADCIRRNLVEQLGTPSRGTQPCNFYVVKNTDMPATLIELGFISNKEEEKLLDSKEGVMKAAQGIFDGIEDYFG
ncbi:MAG: N-acetylmuramoyl-L-alanine amidase [Selenomonadaceae bacterium]|nr:N-acetylmuramoyl-L-alanine amidase [Selenomonadaceae bacterium]